MRSLKDILYGVDIIRLQGAKDINVQDLQSDSRLVGEGSLFIALPGTLTDGHRFIDGAVERGAKAVLCERLPETLKSGITYIQVADTHLAMAQVSGNFYGHPSRKLFLTGITGTNGKTTLATLSYELFRKMGYNTGLLSTVSVKINDESYPATHTTPDAVSLNRYLSEMIEAGVTHCFMEVSSHGIDQKRTAGLHFSAGVFTNLTHDHLDYHGTFKAYRDTKKQFFDQLPETAFALVNADDRNAEFMLQNTRARKRTYALKSPSDYQVRILENSLQGLWIRLNGTEMTSRLIGNFNAYNLAAIYGIAREYGLPEEEVLRLMSTLESVRGRFQYFTTENHVTVIVDYAHTPDALKNVLRTLGEIRNDDSHIITVVGAGGDRDKTKRPRMAEIGVRLSDMLILTSDNPRSENPDNILSDMEAGIPEEMQDKVLRIPDRKQAIKTAARLAKPGDRVLIAGKGHETYQEIQGVKYEFDDYIVAYEIFNN